MDIGAILARVVGLVQGELVHPWRYEFRCKGLDGDSFLWRRCYQLADKRRSTTMTSASPNGITGKGDLNLHSGYLKSRYW